MHLSKKYFSPCANATETTNATRPIATVKCMMVESDSTVNASNSATECVWRARWSSVIYMIPLVN